MTSRVSWSVEGIEPSVRDRADAAARRAGMSLNDWLNSTIGEPTPARRNSADVDDIHHRLDTIARQIEQMSQTGSAPKREGSGVARHLNDAISRLDARLSQISTPPSAPPLKQPSRPQPARASSPVPPRPATERPAPATAYRQAPPTIPEMLEFDVSEIIARQNQLNRDTPRAMMESAAPPIAPQAAVAPDLSGFEKQLQYLTKQIEGLRRPDNTDQAISAFRSELAEMRQVITEALPRRALESLENEIRAVSRRIDESRQSGGDGHALHSVEQALRDIHITLRTLTPAEQLKGFDEAIRNLGGKIDMIVRTSADSGSIHQLESAIGALRAIVSNVASNEALSRLSDDVQTLGSKVDQLSGASGFSSSMVALEQRIAALTSNMENRERPLSDSSELESAVRTLSDRIDHLQVGNDTSATLAHLEQRVSQLLERLDRTDSRMTNVVRIEENLSDILRQLEQQRTSLAALSDSNSRPSSAPRGMDQEVVDAIRRELADMRLGRNETDRNTQDALESVHNTLGHVVDRLSLIEGDLRDSRYAKAAAAPQRAPTQDAFVPQAAPVASRMAAVSPQARPELPNPAALAVAAAEPTPTAQFTTAPMTATKAVLSAALVDAPAAATPAYETPSARTPIDASLPPDFPLEPGSRLQDRGQAAPTSSQRIAASEQVLSEIPSASQEAITSSNFIAAARRAAQAASNPPKDADKQKTGRLSALNSAARANAQADGARSKVPSRIRSLLVSASVVVIILSGFKMAMTMYGGSEPAPSTSIEIPAEKPLAKSSDASPSFMPPDSGSSVPPSVRAGPMIISPAQIDHQGSSPGVIMALPPADNAAPAPVAPKAPDVTGSIAPPPASTRLTADQDSMISAPAAPTSFTPVADTLPDAIGGPVLRAAALKGDPSAAYEVAVRFADGKGVPVNYDEAAKWYDRAADGGIVPAMFRLGTLYEKGLGGKKDVDAARRYYIRAAERGNAKAMHNLAVLDADGGNKGPNYKSASQWFAKAAERGVADSQYNLGILYARGIGVEQNLAESFKWFSLAAAQGDADAARKRDDIAKRLDAQSLAAAKLATQTFAIEPQPDDAIKVASPAAGWDAPAAATTASKRPAKSASRLPSKQTASAH